MRINNISIQTARKGPLKPRSFGNQDKSVKKHDLFINTKNYVIPFLGKLENTAKTYSQNELEFIKVRDEFAEKYEKEKEERVRQRTKYYMEASQDNEKYLKEEQDDVNQLFRDEKLFETLKKIETNGVNDPELKRHLGFLLKKCEQEIEFKHQLDDLNSDLLKIESSYTNSKCMLNGEEITYSQLRKMYKSKDLSHSQKIEVYKAMYSREEAIIPAFIDLMKKRNEFANKMGYGDYFEYILDYEYGVNADELVQQVKTLAKEVRPTLNHLPNVDNSVRIQANNLIKSKGHLIDLSKKMYKALGWDLDDFDYRFDLEPRHGKKTGAFCFAINPPEEVLVFANVEKENKRSFEIINHENGHGLYFENIDPNLSALDRDTSSKVLSETVAMLFESLYKREPEIMVDIMGAPKDLAQKLSKKRKIDLAKFIPSYARYIIFEREMYKNLAEEKFEDPQKDITDLWHNLNNEFLDKKIPSLKMPEWMKIMHFRSYPGYLQNYLRAEMAASQIYKSFEEQHGKMMNNPETRKFFDKKFFAKGKTLSEDEMMINLTGKKLNPDALIEEIKSLKKSDVASV